MTVSRGVLGYTRRPGRTTAERLEERLVDGPNGCREFTGYTNPQGYGETSYEGGKFVYAHRLAWELANGRPVPPGLHVCHTCDNPPCCEPTHLFAGTQQQNNADRDAKGRQWHQGQAHCKWNHPFDEVNTYWMPSGARGCRICRRDASARSYARKRRTP